MAEPIRELRHRPMTNLRVPPGSAAAGRIAEALGTPLPAPNTVATGTHTVLWLGPDEWLVLGAGARELLTSALGADFGSVVDVSANRTTFALSAPWARDVLAKGVSIDLHPSVFSPGRCAQTLLARAQVILQQVDEEPTYHVLVRGSFAPYLAAWLADAAGEFVG
jgi:sarcosine oxidase, subunit gamma